MILFYFYFFVFVVYIEIRVMRSFNLIFEGGIIKIRELKSVNLMLQRLNCWSTQSFLYFIFGFEKMKSVKFGPPISHLSVKLVLLRIF